ncbi:MAG: GNAT family N-acetyltransferase [Planctomycetota bacterium]
MASGETSVVIRAATMGDVPAVVALMNGAAQYGLMLPRTLGQVYEGVREFVVAEEGGKAEGRSAKDEVEGAQIVGCCGLSVVGPGVGELVGLVVDGGARGRGLGAALVGACVDDARRLRVRRLVALTFERGFFERQGFAVIGAERLPPKAWADSVRCAKLGSAHGREEVAMERVLEDVGEVAGPGEVAAAALEYRVPFVARRLGRGVEGETR